VNPGNAVVPGRHGPLAKAPYVDLRFRPPDSQNLDFQQVVAAGSLRNIARGRQLVAVEIAHDLSARFGLPHVAKEDRLLENRTANALFATMASMASSASWACC